MRHGETCIANTDEQPEPWRVYVWTREGYADGYWSHWASYDTREEAERIARAVAGRDTYHGVGLAVATWDGGWNIAVAS